MNGESRIPPALTVALVIVTLAVGVAAYYMGRFGRSSRRGTSPAAELPMPAASAPPLGEAVPTPADIPPTVTPAVPVVIERGRPSSKVLVERSSQIVVTLPTALPTPIPAEVAPAPRRRIVIEVRPTPTPIAPELEHLAAPQPVDTPEPPEETPEPEPTALPGYVGGRPASISSLGSAIAFSFSPRSTHT